MLEVVQILRYDDVFSARMAVCYWLVQLCQMFEVNAENTTVDVNTDSWRFTPNLSKLLPRIVIVIMFPAQAGSQRPLSTVARVRSHGSNV